MPHPLKLHTHHNVTMLNKDMLLGGLMGSAVLAVNPALVVPAAITTAAGGLIGGYVGMRRLDKENREGKIVTTPSLINKEALIGGLTGAQIGAYVGAAALVVVVGFLVAPELLGTPGGLSGLLSSLKADTLAPEIMEKLVNPILAGLGAWATSIASGTAIGAYIGAKAGYKRMEREFDMAQEQQRGNELTTAAKRAQEPAREPEIAKEKSFIQALEQERATVEQGAVQSQPR